MKTKMKGVVCWVCCWMVLAGCAGTDFSASDLPDEVANQGVDYQIGPGDELQIFVWDHEDLSTEVQVRPDGMISTPLVEDLLAAGKTPTQLGRDIEQVLAEYVRSPMVTVIMQGFIGASSRQVRVVQGTKPRAIQFRQGMTVLDLMIAIGGLSELAAGNRAKLIRQVNGESVEIRVRLENLLNAGDMDENLRVFPGDILIIPESFF